MIKLNKIYCEPCLSTVDRIDDNSIDCVITSPPYWQLRDYGYPEQWGLEPTFQEYLEHLWQLMDGIKRILKPTGTAWINLGDTYGTPSGGMRNAMPKNTGVKSESFGNGISQPNLNLHKCLLLIPHRFAIGCIDRGWIMRNDIIWAKRNGMPESVTDRFSKKHEYFFFMVKSEKYFFDLDAIRDNINIESVKRSLRGNSDTHKYANADMLPKGTHCPTMKLPRKFQGYDNLQEVIENTKGKNPGSCSDFWDIPTKPSSEKHYASYNDSLLVKPVLAGCPEGGIIYDPFMGTGSTAEVAIRSGRKFIGSEMSKEYCEIAHIRLEPFLQQKTLF